IINLAIEIITLILSRVNVNKEFLKLWEIGAAFIDDWPVSISSFSDLKSPYFRATREFCLHHHLHSFGISALRVSQPPPLVSSNEEDLQPPPQCHHLLLHSF